MSAPNGAWLSISGSGLARAMSAAGLEIVTTAPLTVTPCLRSAAKARERFSGVMPSSDARTRFSWRKTTVAPTPGSLARSMTRWFASLSTALRSF